jgi:hypothetical protein
LSVRPIPESLASTNTEATSSQYIEDTPMAKQALIVVDIQNTSPKASGRWPVLMPPPTTPPC